MRQFASRQKKYCSITSARHDEERPLPKIARRPTKPSRAVATNNKASAMNHELPLGAIHVNARGIVLEHRPSQTVEHIPLSPPIAGMHIGTIAPWAKEQAFVSALTAAIAGTEASFHFDFKRLASSGERVIHVNILAVGDQSVWIFISDRTLAMISA
jgi:hypothetical protein